MQPGWWNSFLEQMKTMLQMKILHMNRDQTGRLLRMDSAIISTVVLTMLFSGIESEYRINDYLGYLPRKDRLDLKPRVKLENESHLRAYCLQFLSQPTYLPAFDAVNLYE